MTTLDVQEIRNILPHRYPFLMVDRVTELEPGERAVAIKNVSVNEEVFQGHFPGNPTFPGVMMLEALAQTGAIAILSMPEFAGKTAYLGGISKARFRQRVTPGDQLTLEVTLTRMRGAVGEGKGVVSVNGKKATTADLTFVIGE